MTSVNRKQSAVTAFSAIYYLFLAFLPIWIVVASKFVSDWRDNSIIPYSLILLPITFIGAMFCFIFYALSKKQIGTFFAHLFATILFFAIPIAMYIVGLARHA